MPVIPHRIAGQSGHRRTAGFGTDMSGMLVGGMIVLRIRGRVDGLGNAPVAKRYRR